MDNSPVIVLSFQAQHSIANKIEIKPNWKLSTILLVNDGENWIELFEEE